MLAVTIVGPRQTAIADLALPALGPDDAEIRVLACGICGSNLHAWAHPELTIQKDGQAKPGAAGHEIAGVVVRVGSEVVGLEPGQQVCVEPNRATGCGVCPACAEGGAWFCRSQTDLACWGFAESMIVPARSLLSPSAPLDPAVLTLVEPLACAFHALRSSWTATSRGLEGKHVAVVGAGVAGLLAVAAARSLGAGRITCFARHPHQALAAKALGADHVVEGTVGADDEIVYKLKADLVLEMVGGRADSFGTSLAAVNRGGEVVVVGLFDEPQTFDARKAVFREIRMNFAVTYSTLEGIPDYRFALDLLVREQQTLAQLVTHRVPLDAIDEAFALASDKASGALRVVVTP
jgi:(R,R)-butanediol dehydrogenase / meso-butanediol dehydrogenase / diacetyl reductase